MGAELLHAEKNGRSERQTDMTKLIVSFRNFANAPKDGLYFKTLLTISSTKYESLLKTMCEFYTDCNTPTCNDDSEISL